MKVLYVEDDPRDAELARHQLAHDSPWIELDVALGLGDARARLAAPPAYDLVLADLRLPDGLGLELLSEIRERGLPLAVVILTGQGDEATAVAALKAGADDYLPKRKGYLARLPFALESALARFRAEAARKAGVLRVLYGEHHPADIDLTRRHLAAYAPHIRLEVVHSAPEVLARIPANAGDPSRWDVILLDYRLPGQSALDVLKVLHDERRLDVPVVLVTGQGDEEVAAQALRLGAVDYLVKHPNYLYELPAALENAYHRARLVREQAALRQSEDRYRDLVENSQDPIGTHDLEGELLSVNEAAARLSGYPREQLLRMNLAELLAPDVRDCLGAYLAELRSAGRARGITRIRTAGGDTRYWEYDNTLRTEGVDVPVVRGVARDVTERIRLEAQLRQAQKMESIGRLAGGIAHDFNNLLTIINAYAQLAVTQLPEDDPVRGEVEEIQRAGVRAAALTRQLLAFSRLQVVRPSVLNLNTAITGVEKMLRPLLGKDVTLTTVLAGDLGSVKADAGQIEQVIINLAINARDAMPDGGELTIRTADVDLDEKLTARDPSVSPGPYVMLEIADVGSGMDEPTRERIFEPFFTTKEPGQGTGLGLSMVYGIVKQAGGSIRVESEVGRGSAFRIYLPRVEAEPDADHGPRPSRPATAAGGTETILVVENEEAVRRLTSQVLRSAGYTVLTAADGAEALVLMERRTEPVRLLLTDVVMPGLGGRELAARLRPSQPHMRVLYMSTGTPDGALGRELEEGADFISKPFAVADLTRQVREVLER